uniref:KRAB domain-containing protein n=1 Tax=Podarcis muralis TaxID=64176 RepID=A0A670HNN0_PODMU
QWGEGGPRGAGRGHGGPCSDHAWWGETPKSGMCFEDVAVPFTEEGWAFLDPDQRALQKEVKEENRGIVASLVRLPAGS